MQSEGSLSYDAERGMWQVVSPASVYPRDYISGLKINYVSAYQVTIDTGVCRSDDNTEVIEVATSITLDITASGAGGLDTGTEAADTWYYVWLIKNSSTGDVSGVFSTSSSAPTLPEGYDKKRLLGAVRNDSDGDFLKFYTNILAGGRALMFLYDLGHKVLDRGQATSWTVVDCSNFVPENVSLVRLIAHVHAAVADTICYALLRTVGSSGTLAYDINILTMRSDASADHTQAVAGLFDFAGQRSFEYIQSNSWTTVSVAGFIFER